jgi:predicted DNA-binding protein (UPF0251 family)
MSAGVIAVQLGMSRDTVERRLKRDGVKMRGRREAALLAKETPDLSVEKVRELYERDGKTIQAGAKSLGISEGVLRRFMKRNGIRCRKPGKIGQYAESRYKPISVNISELVDDYVVREMTLERAGRKHGISHATVSKLLRKHGVVIRMKTVPLTASVAIDDARLIELHNNGFTQQDAADELGCCRDTLRKHYKRLGLKARHASASNVARRCDKLNAEKVVELRALRLQGWTWPSLAERYQIHILTAENAGKGYTWKRVAGGVNDACGASA